MYLRVAAPSTPAPPHPSSPARGTFAQLWYMHSGWISNKICRARSWDAVSVTTRNITRPVWPRWRENNFLYRFRKWSSARTPTGINARVQIKFPITKIAPFSRSPLIRPDRTYYINAPTVYRSNFRQKSTSFSSKFRKCSIIWYNNACINRNKIDRLYFSSISSYCLFLNSIRNGWVKFRISPNWLLCVFQLMKIDQVWIPVF